MLYMHTVQNIVMFWKFMEGSIQFRIRLFQEIQLKQPQFKLQNSHFTNKQQNSLNSLE